MYAFAALATALVLSTPTLARVVGISVPTSVVAGQSLPVEVEFEDYIENYDDFGLVFGLSRPEETCGTCVGQLLNYTQLYPHGPISGNVTYEIPIDSYATPGDYFLNVGDFYLVAAAGRTGVNYFNSSLTIQNASCSTSS